MSVNIDVSEVLKRFSVNPDVGLDDAKVQEYISTNGKNKLKEQKKKNNLQRFLDQFKDAMIIILLIAAVVSFGIAIVQKDTSEFFEPILILVIVVINAVMGVLQENKAEEALESLKKLSSTTARVIRNGKESVVDSECLVPGDIVILEAGDFIPADLRIISCASLTSDESTLTGESVPTEKSVETLCDSNVPLGDMKNMLFSGCSVSTGTAKAVVVNTAMDTQVAKIANLLDTEDKQTTPLQKKLAQLGKYLGFVALGACVVIFIMGWLNGINVLEMFITSISLAVSAIPEGLPAVITIILSIGVQRMAKKNAIVRSLPAVEALGGASVICSDKTGTLTQNKMTLTQVYSNGRFEEITENNSENVCRLLMLATLCTDATVDVVDGKENCIGDPTETSIISAMMKNKTEKNTLQDKYPRLYEIPFDSDRKLMTTVNDFSGTKIVIVKGAFDVLEKLCINKNTDKFRMANEKMSNKALRVIAVACKKLNSDNFDNLESDLELIGLLGMIDPPREGVDEAVKLCKNAGIKPVMITGDHIATACAIAKELGIFAENDKAITGVQLAEMKDEELLEIVKDISVYARVSPEDKIKIVKAWKSQNAVVAMTGDGVNDAPALKAADIGCAMGITGTDVAKGASDITLADDNFSTIVDAVKEGRGIYANIRKVIGYLLGTNLGEILTVFFAMILWHQTPLISVQLLWINLVTDSFPAIGLGMEKIEDRIMSKPPESSEKGFFANGLGFRIIIQGLMFGGLTLFAFKLGDSVGGTLYGRTMAFFVLALLQVFQAFNMRSDRSLFKIGIFSNRNLNIASIVSLILIAVVLFTPLLTIFGFTVLPPIMYLEALGISLIPTILQEILKFFKIIK